MNPNKWQSYLDRHEGGYSEPLNDWSNSPEDWSISKYATLFARLFPIPFALYGAGHSVKNVRHCATTVVHVYIDLLDHRGRHMSRRRLPEGSAPGESELVEEQYVDYSEGNSWQSLQVFWLALSIGERNLASTVAAKIWDPPRAEYVGPSSEVCLTAQQAAAYWFKEWWSDRGQVERVPSRPSGLTRDLGLAVDLYIALSERDRSGAVRRLQQGLQLHRQVVGDPAKLNDPRKLLYLPGTAALSIAASDGLIEVDEFENTESFLPLLTR